ncbi:uncharacterized protein LOC143452522 [Clavelina lepadiformis]|uniref:uncharacterized protein LOC143452522 n=1 Tax=Clavelina lepadiformis TaxID=159417 RepID=UPI0040434AC5
MATLSSSSAVSSNPSLPNFDLFAKLRFESEKSSFLRRSQLFKLPEKAPTYDVWKLQPPNFNPQVFEPAPVERNSKEAVKPWIYDQYTSYTVGSAPNARERRRNDKRKMDFFNELEKAAAEKQQRAQTCGDFRSRSDAMRLRFKIPDPHQTRVDFVRRGMYKPGVYEMPQPHDFRQYPPLKSLGLPEFITDYEHDCLGLKCKTAGLSTLNGPQAYVLRQVEVRKKSEYEMSRPLKWDKQLVLPKVHFPNKIAAYTRHRRTDRSARSAYLERAESMMEKRRKEVEEFQRTRLSKFEES